jgi:hypothetical protein
MSINYTTPDFTLYAMLCYGGPCDTFDTIAVDVAVPEPFAVTITGPATRTTGVQGTWTASITPGPSVGPYTYSWGDDVWGSSSSIDWTFWDEAPHWISVTVTDANGLQTSTSRLIYVCADVC